MPDSEIPAGAAFAYEVGQQTLASQSALVDALDTKAAVVLGANGLLAGILLNSIRNAVPAGVLVVASCSLLLSLTLAVLCFLTARYHRAPEFSAVAERIGASDNWLRWRFLPNIQAAVQANQTKLRRKGRLLMLAITALFMLVVDLGGYLIYATWNA